MLSRWPWLHRALGNNPVAEEFWCVHSGFGVRYPEFGGQTLCRALLPSEYQQQSRCVSALVLLWPFSTSTLSVHSLLAARSGLGAAAYLGIR